MRAEIITSDGFIKSGPAEYLKIIARHVSYCRERQIPANQRNFYTASYQRKVESFEEPNETWVLIRFNHIKHPNCKTQPHGIKIPLSEVFAFNINNVRII